MIIGNSFADTKQRSLYVGFSSLCGPLGLSIYAPKVVLVPQGAFSSEPLSPERPVLRRYRFVHRVFACGQRVTPHSGCAGVAGPNTGAPVRIRRTLVQRSGALDTESAPVSSTQPGSAGKRNQADRGAAFVRPQAACLPNPVRDCRGTKNGFRASYPPWGKVFCQQSSLTFPNQCLQVRRGASPSPRYVTEHLQVLHPGIDSCLG